MGRRFFLGLFALTAAASAADPRLADAARRQDRAAIQSLLSQKVDPSAAQPDGTTALHWAVRQDDLDTVDRLIQAGADVKAANRYGVTPLYLACVNGNPEIIEHLLRAGADANAAVTEGETALMTAARSGRVEAAKVLLAHGANVNAREAWRGQTALMWASAQNHPAMAKLLIDSGAEVDARSAIQQWERQVTAEPREKWLPPGGLTPLLFAARQGALECARILLDAGADINRADPDGITPLLSSIINGHYDVAVLLTQRGANPNLADKTGRTPLFSAVDFHTMPASNRPSPRELDNELTSMDVIKALLAQGADVNAQLTRQQPYRVKLDRGDDTVLAAGTTPLLRAAKAGDYEVVKMLLEKGADAKLSTRNGVNPLMVAAGVGTKEEDTTGRHKTQEDVIETIKLCLAAGLDINAADNRGETALHGAALMGYDKVAGFLIQHGAKVDARDRRGFTPLDAALGKAGGLGFDGAAGVPHPETAAILERAR
jgi:ankyrin repeat protein